MDPVMNLPVGKSMYTCPNCSVAPVWGKDSFECPKCTFGRDLRLWSQTRWNDAVTAYDKKQQLKRVVPSLGTHTKPTDDE